MKRQKLRKQGKKHSSRRTRNRRTQPRTAEQYFARSAQFQDKWTRVTHVISKMRADKVSLQQASREYGLDPRTVIRLGRSALRKGTDRRYNARASDRLLRVFGNVPSRGGLRVVATRDSRQASQLAEYENAVQEYLETGDDSALRKFRRKRITDARGGRIPLLTNLGELDRLGSAGVLSFESLYAKAG